MADVTIYKPAGVNVVVIDGDPPADQSALVAQLISERDAALAQRDALQAKIDAAIVAAQADKDDDAANVAGQGVLDALS